MKVYTRAGDDGTTGLLYGGRVRKDAALPSAYGEVDEAQAVLGLARAEAERGGELDTLLVALCRDLWIVMTELATAPENRHKLTAHQHVIEQAMIDALEARIDELSARFDPPTEFVIPGENRVSAALDLGRTVVRRAERAVLADGVSSPLAVAYLNRLSDLLWTMARWQEGEHLHTRSVDAPGGAPS